MKKVELYIIPHAKEDEIKTRLTVDGNRIDSKDNRFTNLVVYQPMRKWLNPYRKMLFVWDGFLAELIEEFNDNSVHFVFRGCKADFTVFRKSIIYQQTKLNRNGGASQVSFEFIDKVSPNSFLKELSEILEDLRVEADNWGEDEIIDSIDSLESEIGRCRVKLRPDYLSSADEFKSLLQKQNVSVADDSVLTVIPFNGEVPASGICDLITDLLKESCKDEKYMIVNTSAKENEALFEDILSLEEENDPRVKYIENDGEDFVKEIEKEYFMLALPGMLQKASRILRLFPDCDTNSFLVDVSDRIDDLICRVAG